MLELRFQLVRSYPGTVPDYCRLPRHYPLIVETDRTDCEDCGTPLRAQWLPTRFPVSLMLGEPELKHRLKRCPRCRKVYRCEKLDTIVPPKGRYAFDVIAEVGRTRTLDNRQAPEIQAHFASRFQLALPITTVGHLITRFLMAIATVHEAYAPRLKEWFRRKHGGYILHLDGTCEAGTRVVFIAVEGESKLTLFSRKIPSEAPKDIERFLRKCVRLFGRPLATVRDLSENIRIARDAVLKGVPDFVCEHHLLTNIAKRLCEKPRQALSQRLRHHGMRTALTATLNRLRSQLKGHPPLSFEAYEAFLRNPRKGLEARPTHCRRLLAATVIGWMQDYVVDLRGEFFPFDQPELRFYKRGRELFDWLARLLKSGRLKGRDWRLFQNLHQVLAPTRQDPELVEAARQLETAFQAFEECREVFRLDKPEGGSLLRQHPPRELTVEDLRERDRNLTKYRKRLDKDMKDKSQPERARHAKIIAGQFDKYKHRFLGRIVKPGRRKPPIVVTRTNYPAEHKFRHRKNGWRRQSGNKKLAKRLDTCHEEELLVDNLLDEDYVDVMYDGSLENMAQRFAEHWPDIVKRGLMPEDDEDAESATPSRKSRVEVSKRIVRLPGLLGMIASAISSLAE